MSQKKEKIQEQVYGIHPILELLKAKRRRIYTIYTTKPEPKSWELLARHLPKDVQIQYVSRDVLTRIAGTTDHQSVVAWASPVVIRKKFFDPEASPFLVLLDGVQDPRNVGAILRSIYCTGFNGVIITKKMSAPINAVVLKSSAGLAEHLDIYESATIDSAIDELIKAGYQIYFTTLSGDSAMDISYPKPLCIVIGNEATGVSRHVVKKGIEIKLPQKKTDISYNASVAAGIILFTVAHQNKII